MNIGGGEAADQLVRMMLSGTEVAVRLGGSALKNMLALSMALAKNNKTISGKINLGKMLRETRDLRQFPMTPEQYKEFSKLAKKQKILFSAIRDKDDQGRLIDVILPVTELDRANMIFERLGYLSPEHAAPQREQQPPQKGRNQPQKQRAERDKAVDRQGQERPQKGPERQMETGRQEAAPPKKDSRSEQGSPVIKPSSSTPKEAEATRTTSERPSIEGRLKSFREQLAQKQKSVPTREKSKGKSRPKMR